MAALLPRFAIPWRPTRNNLLATSFACRSSSVSLTLHFTQLFRSILSLPFAWGESWEESSNLCVFVWSRGAALSLDMVTGGIARLVAVLWVTAKPRTLKDMRRSYQCLWQVTSGKSAIFRTCGFCVVKIKRLHCHQNLKTSEQHDLGEDPFWYNRPGQREQEMGPTGQGARISTCWCCGMLDHWSLQTWVAFSAWKKWCEAHNKNNPEIKPGNFSLWSPGVGR